jgi:hypothetical protein
MELALPHEFNATSLTISTCTVLCNLNKRLSLELITRFAPVHELQAPELNEKSGGLYNIEFYGNCARGETMTDKINEMFNNQTTIKFKYWGFRMVNIKIFRNGRLQMTGLKHEEEAPLLASLLIDIISQITIPINQSPDDIIKSSRTFDMQILYDSKTKKITYYRRYYTKFLNPYKFNLEELYHHDKTSYTPKANPTANPTVNPTANPTVNPITNPISIYQQLKIELKGKNFEKGVHDIYLDNTLIPTNELLESNDWYGDLKILKVIDMLEFVKEYTTNHIENILSSSITLKDLRDAILKFQLQITDFRYPELTAILDNIDSDLYSTDEQTLIDVKSKIHTILKQYRIVLTKKITRLIFIRNCDVSICKMLEEYLTNNPIPTPNKNGSISINIHNLDSNLTKEQTIQPSNPPVLDNNISSTNPYGYYVSGTETVMINSDLLVNYNINLKKMAKILKKKGLFNTYDPDEHSGVNLKYYWNKANDNNELGICKCTPHCSTKEKKSICNKITILIFRPGSIVITGSRTLEQLCAAHKFTIKLLKETMDSVRIDEKTDDTKQLALLNNEARKISRKPRLFYIKKGNLRHIQVD